MPVVVGKRCNKQVVMHVFKLNCKPMVLLGALVMVSGEFMSLMCFDISELFGSCG